MASDYTELLREQVVIAAMSAAWLDSQPGVSGGHEEGGFILRNANGQIEILRWVTGVQNMALTLIADVYKDAVAMSTANVMAVANKRAKELGVDTLNSLITMTQYIQDGMMFWRVNYGAKDYLDRRGGDLIIDVDAINGKIDRILWGQ